LQSVSSASVGFRIAGCRTAYIAKNIIMNLLPLPCVCQTTPERRSSGLPLCIRPASRNPNTSVGQALVKLLSDRVHD